MLTAFIPVGLVLENPGGGTSTILECSQSFIKYRRGKSTIRVEFKDLYSAYTVYKGRRVSSSDLKQFAPSVFDSRAKPAGHSCNATLLFILLRESALSGDIGGGGVRGNPFFVHIL